MGGEKAGGGEADGRYGHTDEPIQQADGLFQYNSGVLKIISLSLFFIL